LPHTGPGWPVELLALTAPVESVVASVVAVVVGSVVVVGSGAVVGSLAVEVVIPSDIEPCVTLASLALPVPSLVPVAVSTVAPLVVTVALAPAVVRPSSPQPRVITVATATMSECELPR